ncbi:MAG: AAA family ATPase [Pseudomonadota bacterium]
MNKPSPNKPASSLLERASELYDFGAIFRRKYPVASNPSADLPSSVPPTAVVLPEQIAAPTRSTPPSREAATPSINAPCQMIDRAHLVAQNFLLPDGPVTGLSEEFRIVKRQLLLAARGGKGVEAVPFGERILVCSANPDEGKTFCAINLALSMANEKDNRVLLVDADFPKPSVLKALGINSRPGFMDALADPKCDVESLVIPTDIDGLSILPAGGQSNLDTEYLAATRTEQVIDELSRNDPARIIIFDSPPALAASPASVLALHVGQILMVVHADVTTEHALRDALSLLSGCEHVQLLLNRAKFSPSGRQFGNYYRYGAA